MHKCYASHKRQIFPTNFIESRRWIGLKIHLKCRLRIAVSSISLFFRLFSFPFHSLHLCLSFSHSTGLSSNLALEPFLPRNRCMYFSMVNVLVHCYRHSPIYKWQNGTDGNALRWPIIIMSSRWFQNKWEERSKYIVNNYCSFIYNEVERWITATATTKTTTWNILNLNKAIEAW